MLYAAIIPFRIPFGDFYSTSYLLGASTLQVLPKPHMYGPGQHKSSVELKALIMPSLAFVVVRAVESTLVPW